MAISRVHFCAQMDPVSNTMRGRGWECTSYLKAILTGRLVSVLVWLGLGGEGREESLGRRLSPQTQLFLFLRGSKLLRGRGYTPHGQINSQDIIPAQQLICLQVQLVSLNLERNMISSVTAATLAGLSSLYSLSLAGRSHLSAVLNTNTLLRHISHALDLGFRQPAGNLASAMARSLSLAQQVDSVNCAQRWIHCCQQLPFLIHGFSL